MTNEQLILKYNPANAATFKPEDFQEMRALSDDQIQILAEAFPNQPSRKSYLRLYDTTLDPHKQLYQLSTWQNLRNVRKFSNKKNLVAYDFYQVGAKAAAVATTRNAKVPVQPKKVVVDMTAQEAADELRKSIRTTVTEKVKQKELIKTVNSVEQKIKSAAKPKEVKEKVADDQDFDNGIE